MVKHAGLIFLTVGLGCIFVFAANQAHFRTSGSPLDGAVLRGYESVPSDRVVVKPGVFDLPGPRIYKAVPYSMLVMVPGRLFDDSMIKRARSIDRMPIMRPELKLIPWK